MKIDIYSRTNQLIVDGLVFAGSFVAAYLIRFEGWPRGLDLRQLLLWLPIVVFARLAVHLMMGMYRLVWRFISFSDAIELAKSIAAVSAVLMALRLCVYGNEPWAILARLPLSVIVLDGLLSLTASMGTRGLRRILYSLGRRSAATSGLPGRRVILYGAGRGGIMLSRELETNPAYDVIGFVDDDPRKVGSVISSARVLGTGDELAELVAKYQVDEIIISMATASGEILARVLAKCRRAKVPEGHAQPAGNSRRTSANQSVSRDGDSPGTGHRRRRRYRLLASQAFARSRPPSSDHGQCSVRSGTNS